MIDEINREIHNALQGDMAAFRRIVERYNQRVYSIAYQITGNSMEAQDVAQDVFIRLYRSLKKYNPNYGIAAWLYRMTVNISIDYRRRYKRHQLFSLDSVMNKSEDDCPQIERQTEQNEFKGAIQQLITKLSVKQQKVFVLRDLQDFSTDEIAKILKCNSVTVRVHLANARQRIKQALITYYPELLDRNKLKE